MTLVSIANLILSLLTIIGQLIIVLLIIFSFLYQDKLLKFIDNKALWFSFLVALIATLGSLFYSDIIGYEPCKLCWFQRILMYPQVILLGVAIWKKDKVLAVYNSITLSVIGAVLAGYHYLLQIGIAPELSCGVVGYSSACSQRFVMNFGYITIPMMALTAFVLMVTVLIIQKRNINKS